MTLPEGRNLLRLVPAVILIFCACFSILGHAFLFGDPTTPDDWKAAADFVKKNLSDGETIRVEPVWSDAPLVYLGDVGTRIDRRSELLVEDRYGESGTLVLAENARVDNALSNLGPGLQTLTVTPFGSVSVVHVRYPVDVYSWNARTTLQGASLQRIAGETVEDCKVWDPIDRRWDCGKRDKWVFVRDMVREVGNEPRSCVFMHPLAGKTVRLTYDVPAGKNLIVRAGLDLRASRSVRGTDVKFEVKTDGKLMATKVVLASSNEWFRFDIPMNAASKVSFEVATEKVFDRNFCFDAWLER